MVWTDSFFSVLNNKLIIFHIFKSLFQVVFFFFFNLQKRTWKGIQIPSWKTCTPSCPLRPSPTDNTSVQCFANSSSRHEAPHLLPRHWRASGEHAGCRPILRLQISADKAVDKWADGTSSVGRSTQLAQHRTLSQIHGAVG